MKRASRKEALALGYEVYCINCRAVYEEIPMAVKSSFCTVPEPNCDNCGGGIFLKLDDDRPAEVPDVHF
jgi:hypothetical protein